MTNRANSRNRDFIITSQGVSATRWLAFVLASSAKVFVAHGHFPIDSVACGTFDRERARNDKDSLRTGTQSVDFYHDASLHEVFAKYREMYPKAVVCGNVHSYTLDGLLQRCAQAHEELSNIAVANVVRHPITYIESHTRLVRKSEFYPEIYRGYATNLFPAALRAVPELLLVDCPNYREFFAFVVSCFSVLNVERDLMHEKFKHFRMEALTSEPQLLMKFCKKMTGLNYPLKQMREFVSKGPINRHRRANSKTNPFAIYRGWPHWKRDIVALMLPDATLRRFENLGYEVAMLREPNNFKVTGPKSAMPCLADVLKETDEKHLLLMEVHPSPVAKTNVTSRYLPNAPVELLESLADYNIVRGSEHIYAIRQAVGKVDVRGGPQKLLEEYGPEDLMVAETLDGARARIELKLLSRRLEQIEVDRKRLVESDKQGLVPATPQLLDSFGSYNLVRCGRQFYAIHQGLGELDFSIGPQALVERYGSDKVIFADTLEGAYTRVGLKMLPELIENGASETAERLKKLEGRLTDGAGAGHVNLRILLHSTDQTLQRSEAGGGTVESGMQELKHHLDQLRGRIDSLEAGFGPGLQGINLILHDKMQEATGGLTKSFAQGSAGQGVGATEVRSLQVQIQKLIETDALIAKETDEARNQLNEIRMKIESIDSAFERRMRESYLVVREHGEAEATRFSDFERRTESRFAKFDHTSEELRKLTVAVESNSSLIGRVEAEAERRLLDKLRALDARIGSMEQEVREYSRFAAERIDKLSERIDMGTRDRRQVEEKFHTSQEQVEGLLAALSGETRKQIGELNTQTMTLRDTMNANSGLQTQFERRLSALGEMLVQQARSTDDRIAGLATLLEIQVAAIDKTFAERLEGHERISARITEIASLVHELQSTIQGFRQSPAYRTLQSLYLVSAKPSN